MNHPTLVRNPHSEPRAKETTKEDQFLVTKTTTTETARTCPPPNSAARTEISEAACHNLDTRKPGVEMDDNHSRSDLQAYDFGPGLQTLSQLKKINNGYSGRKERIKIEKTTKVEEIDSCSLTLSIDEFREDEQGYGAIRSRFYTKRTNFHKKNKFRSEPKILCSDNHQKGKKIKSMEFLNKRERKKSEHFNNKKIGKVGKNGLSTQERGIKASENNPFESWADGNLPRRKILSMKVIKKQLPPELEIAPPAPSPNSSESSQPSILQESALSIQEHLKKSYLRFEQPNRGKDQSVTLSPIQPAAVIVGHDSSLVSRYTSQATSPSLLPGVDIFMLDESKMEKQLCALPSCSLITKKGIIKKVLDYMDENGLDCVTSQQLCKIFFGKDEKPNFGQLAYIKYVEDILGDYFE